MRTREVVKIEKTRAEVNGSLLRHQGGLLYKAPLTASVFKDFSACYQHFTGQASQPSEQPFVYVDSTGVKLVTNVVGENDTSPDGVFAISMAQDGWVQMLAMDEPG